ncbi:MAG: hypothetical protein PHV13_01410 [Candidatus ainarchaeum sp.]|nr:hypothetical protein [Candidatus ainarchaeum sp.]
MRGKLTFTHKKENLGCLAGVKFGTGLMVLASALSIGGCAAKEKPVPIVASHSTFAYDSYCGNNTMLELTKPTVVKVGDFVTKMVYSGEAAGQSGWKVDKIDAKGVEVSFAMEIFMSERAGGPAFRINYGEATRVTGRGKNGVGVPIDVEAIEGDTPGTAIVRAVYARDTTRKGLRISNALNYGYWVVGAGAFNNSFLVTKIDASGIEFAADNTRRQPWRLDYGQARRIGEGIIDSITAERGPTNSTAVLKVTYAKMPQDSLRQ